MLYFFFSGFFFFSTFYPFNQHKLNILYFINQSLNFIIVLIVFIQFWAAYVPCEAQYKDAVQLTLEQIDVIIRLTDKYSKDLRICTSAEGNLYVWLVSVSVVYEMFTRLLSAICSHPLSTPFDLFEIEFFFPLLISDTHTQNVG